MDCPTFGTAENHLARRVQSLDRKGDFKLSDRNKVLISRAPKRHKSITRINFYVAPPIRKESAPPASKVPAPVAAPQRPPPRFLELFKPLTTDETTVATTHSGTSTPCSEISPSQPVTPHTAHRCLPVSARQGAPSYFPYALRKHQHIEMPHATQRNVHAAASEQQYPHEGSSDEWDDDEDVDYPTMRHPVYIRESDEWAEHENPANGLGMVAGTFGRA